MKTCNAISPLTELQMWCSSAQATQASIRTTVDDKERHEMVYGLQLPPPDTPVTFGKARLDDLTLHDGPTESTR